MTRSIASRLRALCRTPGRYIGVRLMACMLSLCLLMAAVSVVGLVEMRAVHARFSEAITTRVPEISAAQKLVSDVSSINIAARDLLLSSTPEQGQNSLQRIESGRITIGQQIEHLQALLHDSGDQGKHLAEQLGNQSSSVLVALIKFTRLYNAGKSDLARTLLLDSVQVQMSDIGATLTNIEEFQIEQLRLAERGSAGLVTEFTGIVIGSLCAALICAVILSRALSNNITRSASAMADMAERIADGNLAQELNITRNDELGRLQQAMARMRQQLINLVGDIHQAATKLAETSQNFAEANDELSGRTAATAAALEQSSASIKQLTDTVYKTVNSARGAVSMVDNAGQVAQCGSQAVGRVIDSMQGISASSRRINDIIGVIDSITFQTNLLALNAAVEAARAGEQGRGFAVVASEVRTLSQRSAHAALEIKELIGESVRQVQSGSALVQDTGTTMQNIVASVTQVNSMIGDITQSAELQSQGLNQTTSAINEISAMTQKNADMVQESAAAATQLRQQAVRLEQLVGTFHLPGGVLPGAYATGPMDAADEEQYAA